MIQILSGKVSPWPAEEYIVSERMRKAIYLSDILVKRKLNYTKVSHNHPDPTANEAISNVVRESFRKKHRPGSSSKRELGKAPPTHRCMAGRGERSRMRE